MDEQLQFKVRRAVKTVIKDAILKNLSLGLNVEEDWESGLCASDPTTVKINIAVELKWKNETFCKAFDSFTYTEK